MKLFVDILGWAGALLVLGAYAGVSFRKMRADSARYQLINAAGSLLLMVNTVYHRALPSSVVNLIWICIAIAAGFRLRARENAVTLDE
jgi:hypothetical protein